MTLRRVVQSEWIKFRSLRSTWWVLSVTVVAMILFSVIIGYNTRRLAGHQDPNDLVPSSPLQGMYLAQLLIGALGVLTVSGEFGTGMIRSTFAAVPKRLPVLWAKLAIFTAVSLVLLCATSLVAFLAGEGVISHFRTAYTLSSPGALRVVVGTGVYLTLVGVIGMMIGWIVRSTPGALVAFATVVLVLPVLFGSFLQSWGQTVNQYLPPQAGSSFTSNLPDGAHLSTWAGLAVLILWFVAMTLVAAVSLRRRDV